MAINGMCGFIIGLVVWCGFSHITCCVSGYVDWVSWVLGLFVKYGSEIGGQFACMHTLGWRGDRYWEGHASPAPALLSWLWSDMCLLAGYGLVSICWFQLNSGSSTGCWGASEWHPVRRVLLGCWAPVEWKGNVGWGCNTYTPVRSSCY